MLDLKRIRDDPDGVRAALARRGDTAVAGLDRYADVQNGRGGGGEQSRGGQRCGEAEGGGESGGGPAAGAGETRGYAQRAQVGPETRDSHRIPGAVCRKSGDCTREIGRA